jgi:hypothetical protein
MTCVHHWLVPTSGDAEVIATCKLCGKLRRMTNEWDKIIEDMIIETSYLETEKTLASRRLKTRAESSKKKVVNRTWQA